MAAGADHAPVENSAEGVAALDYLQDTETMAIVVHGREGSAHSEFAYTLRTSKYHSYIFTIKFVDTDKWNVPGRSW